MRSATTSSQVQALANPKDLSTHLRVSVDDGTGSHQDLTDLEGYDWVDSVTYSEAAGKPVSTASVKLKREAYKLSLSPFMDGSKLNVGGTVIDIARKILIETAVLPRGKSPASDEWEKVFRGYIEKTGLAKNPITLSCLDQGAELLRRFIETQRVYAYGNVNDTLLHNVIQDIVDDTTPAVATVAANYTWPGGLVITTGDTSEVVVGDFIGTGDGTEVNRSPYFPIAAITPNVDITITNPNGRSLPGGGGAGDTNMIPAADRITLYVEGANPAWEIHEYYQSKDRVLTAIRKLAQQIGYEVSYRWNTTTSDFELTLWTPDRAAAAPDVTIGPGVFKDIQKFDQDRSKIRNVIKITAMVAGVRTTVTRTDAASVAKYGRCYMEATEKSSSQIDSVAEMQDFGDIIKDDLKDPEADLVGSMPYRWDVQPADYARFEADGVRFDTDQDMGIVSLKHVLPNQGEPKTILAIRGKPGGGVNRWLELEGMPSVSLPVDLKSDTPAENAAATPAAGAIVVVYDDPRTMSPPVDDWAYTRCYVHTADPGDPPNVAYLVDVKKATRFEVTGLIPETTYYCRLVIIDQAGNIAATAAAVSVATEAVGAYHENHDQERGAMNPNPNFGTATKDIATIEPDHWEVDTGSWANTASNWWHQSGTGATHQTSARAVEMNGIALAGGAVARKFRSLPFAVSGAYLYGVTFTWRHDGNSGNKTAWRPTIHWLDEDKAIIGAAVQLNNALQTYTLGPGGFTSAANTWHNDRGWGVSPAGARYALLEIEVLIPVAGGLGGQNDHPTLFFDRFVFTRSLAQLEWAPSAGTNRAGHASATWVAPWFDATDPDIDNAQGASLGVPGVLEHDYDVQFDGQYLIEGIVAWTAGTNGKAFNARIRNNGATLRAGTPNIKYAGSGGYGSVSIGQVALLAGDAIRLEGYHNEGAALIIDNSECALRITQVSTQGSY